MSFMCLKHYECRHLTIATVISFAGTWPASICVPKTLLRPTNVLRLGKAVRREQTISANHIAIDRLHNGVFTQSRLSLLADSFASPKKEQSTRCLQSSVAAIDL